MYPGGMSITRMGAKVNVWYRKVAVCRHELSVSVISDGLEKEICEGCGNVTIRYESVIDDGSIDRNVFARDADSKRPTHRIPRTGTASQT